MGEKNSKPKVCSTNIEALIDEQPAPPIHQVSRKTSLIVWVDMNIKESSADCQRTLTKLHEIDDDLKIFNQKDDFLDFMRRMHWLKIIVVTSGSLGKTLVQEIHHLPQIETILIFCYKPKDHAQWTQKWPKISKISNKIKEFCPHLQPFMSQSNENYEPIDMTEVISDASDQDANVNQIEVSYMYTQMLKKILLYLEYDEDCAQDLIRYSREQYANNPDELQLIDEFEQSYHSDRAIWWYTRPCFLSQLLDRGLSSLDVDTILNLGFFIRDLNRQINQLHKTQSIDDQKQSSIVYRGQTLSMDAFHEIRNKRGGLLSFNCFLTASKNKRSALDNIQSVVRSSNTVAILFVMTINSAWTKTPFVDLQRLDYGQDENTILFSTHTVFRICEIRDINGQNQLSEVQLRLTTDDDQQLEVLRRFLEEEIDGDTEKERIGKLLFRLGHFSKAEQLYLNLLNQKPNDPARVHYFHQMGIIKYHQEQYEKAREYYERALGIQATLKADHSDLMPLYNSMGDFDKALRYCRRAIGTNHSNASSGYTSLATSYTSMGLGYDINGDHEKALNCCEQLSSFHPALADAHHNLGIVYHSMKNYQTALIHFEKVLEIRRKTLPSFHPDMASTFSQMASTYAALNDYQQALSFYDQALQICKSSLPSNGPLLKTIRQWIEKCHEEKTKIVTFAH